MGREKAAAATRKKRITSGMEKGDGTEVI